MAEHERLVLQAAKLAPHTAALLDRVPVTKGGHCLDVGCGTGGGTELLAQRVGPGGSVLALDLDAAVVRWAERSLAEAGHHQCRFIVGDAFDLPLDEHGPFDVVYMRLVLIHADDPVALLRRMWELTAPGGALVVQDYDLRAIASDPPTWVVDEFHRVFGGVFARHGRPVDAGLRLPRWFRQAGIGAPEVTTVNGFVEPFPEIRPYIEGAYRSTLPLAIEAGLTTAEESAAWFEEAAKLPPDYTGIHPLMIGAFAHKRA
ncbi:MAG TPA: methyltransferase domain-containing protein [Solirubrobacteraceae bacterium]|nr:methyltransferase domain-containing protein [Solirubrobacteraceae bacterium]